MIFYIKDKKNSFLYQNIPRFKMKSFFDDMVSYDKLIKDLKLDDG